MIHSLVKYLPEIISTKLRDNPVYSRVAKGAFWSLLGSLAAQGLTILSSIPVARLLGAENYGGLGIVQSTVATFVIFAGPALGVAATKHIAELRNSDPERVGKITGMTFSVGLIISTLMAVALWVAAPFLAAVTLNAPDLVDILRIASVVLFFNGLVGVQNGILVGFEAFRPMAQVNLLRGIVSFPAMIVGTWFWQLPGAVLALGVIALVTALANQRVIQSEAAKRGVGVQYFAVGSELGILYRFSLPALLSSIVVVTTTWGVNAILVNQPNGYAHMGIFNAANQWRIAILFLPSILSKPVLPMLSESLNRSLEEYKQVFKLNLAITTGISVLLALGVIAMSPWIMAAYGSDFAQQWIVLVLLALSAVFSSIAGVIGNTIWSLGRMWTSLALNATWAAVFLGVSLYTIGKWGVVGLATAYVAAYGFHLVLHVWYVVFPLRLQLTSGQKS